MTLTLNNLSYTIGTKTILSEISHQFSDQGLYLLLGQNGSGKTTLLKLIHQIIKPTSGSIDYNNQQLNQLPKFYQTFGFLAQYQYLYHQVTLEYFLKLNRYLVTGHLDRDDHFNQIVVKLNLTPLLNRTLTTLSGGERQWGMVGALLMLETPILLMDEPFNHLDPRGIALLMELIAELLAPDHLIILTTHQFSGLLPTAKGILGLKNGVGSSINSNDRDQLNQLFDMVENRYISL